MKWKKQIFEKVRAEIVSYMDTDIRNHPLRQISIFELGYEKEVWIFCEKCFTNLAEVSFAQVIQT